MVAGLGQGLWDGPVLVCGFLRKVNKKIASRTELEVKHEQQVQAAEGEEGCCKGKMLGADPWLRLAGELCLRRTGK